MEDRRKGKLTISETLDDNNEKVRSLAAVKRAREKAKLRLEKFLSESGTLFLASHSEELLLKFCILLSFFLNNIFGLYIVFNINILIIMPAN